MSTRLIIADLLEELGRAGSADALRYADGLELDPTDEELELEEALGKIDDIDDILSQLDDKTLTPFAAIKRLREIMSHGG
jgi:hypothetical protein